MDDGLLIEMVQNHELLYDRTNRDFKNKIKRRNAWETIGTVLKSTAEAVEQRWTVLRNCFTQEKRKIRNIPSGSGSEGASMWRFYTCMQFVDKHIVERCTSGNYKLPLKSRSEYSQNSVDSPWDSFSQLVEMGSLEEDEGSKDLDKENLSTTMEPLPNESSSTPSASSSTSTPTNGEVHTPRPISKRKWQDEMTAFGKVIDGAFSKIEKVLREDDSNDEDDLFGKTIAASLKYHKDRKIKSRIKIEILQILGKYED